MNRWVAKFDRWVLEGDFSALDVARFRMIYATVALFTLPNPSHMAAFPDSTFNAPFGPFRLLQEFPPLGVLNILQWALACALVMLAVGLFTRTASVTVTVLLLVINGIQFSSGKIDHSIIFVLAPAILSFADWGRRASVDALIKREEASAPVAQWPLRLFGVVIGVAFATAAIQKLLSGWLNPLSQATQGHFIRQFVANGRDDWLTPVFLRMNTPVLWETLDWVTILFEFAFLLAILNWRAWRIVLAVACLFHLGVLLMMNIAFYPNVVAYGAFVLWSALGHVAPRAHSHNLARALQVLALPGIFIVGSALWWALREWGTLEPVLGPAIVLAGAGTAVAYLAYLTRLYLVRILSGAHAKAGSGPT